MPKLLLALEELTKDTQHRTDIMSDARKPSSRDVTSMAPCFIFDTAQIPVRFRRGDCRSSEETTVTHLRVSTVAVVLLSGLIGFAFLRMGQGVHSDAASFATGFVSSNSLMYIRTTPARYTAWIKCSTGRAIQRRTNIHVNIS